ncbi:alpha/beta fold hydrolase [Ciceribacter sp. L1K23]|uniref:alpha/beta fold hydrolase n=1 Tax=Ciceribacter sp. L1K23 TaxID=2820276 RepID=UPI001B82EE02|nr:alpha/beta fold hydrolase [Ciceribacter sp. L1K23]MBR0554873.1 alpha/beta fold hydrolase [Ciceribacter sp. L1K23]
MGLHAAITGNLDDAPPLVLLHGFGGDGHVWDEVVAALAGGPPLVVYDLPGHGGSVDAENPGGAGRMAKALLSDLSARGISHFHLAGHSLGGATAALIALRAPERVLTATLLAPGGFGPEINHRVLRRFSLSVDRPNLAEALAAMMAEGRRPLLEAVDRLWNERQRPGARELLSRVFEAMMRPDGKGGWEQGTIDMSALAQLSMPVTVVWGDEDAILPVPDETSLPDNLVFRRWTGIGHMLPEEAPDAVADLLKSIISGAG